MLAWLFFVASLAPMLAHLIEFPNKMDFARDAYLTAQRIYDGWSLFGAAIYPGMVVTLILAYLVRRDRAIFTWTLLGFLGLALSQVVFWTFTYPVNVATNSWTMMPDNWESLRATWEYAHVVEALLTLAGFGALTWSTVGFAPSPRTDSLK